MNKSAAKRAFIDTVAPTLEPLSQEMIDWAFDVFRRQLFFRGIIRSRQCYRWKHHGMTPSMIARRLHEPASARNSRDNHRIRYRRVKP